MKIRSLSRPLLSGLLGVSMVFGLQGQAQAVVFLGLPESRGHGEWNSDPDIEGPGDAIKACDDEADGWGIEVGLDTNHNGEADRIATTRGHTAGYCSPWATGDLPENQTYQVYVRMVSGDDTAFYEEYTVTS